MLIVYNVVALPADNFPSRSISSLAPRNSTCLFIRALASPPSRSSALCSSLSRSRSRSHAEGRLHFPIICFGSFKRTPRVRAHESPFHAALRQRARRSLWVPGVLPLPAYEVSRRAVHDVLCAHALPHARHGSPITAKMRPLMPLLLEIASHREPGWTRLPCYPPFQST